ncbi:tyrosine-type recombinase/integrase [Pseudonocardia sp. RS010]|uniref:tyrosine-type recombinase/integrase n=1 Tax=Pseudonocardia sp. RS010 TaxID=3385979 RepID=UPI0039A20074
MGLPPVRLHDLRHGAASLMLAAGVPMKVIQETLGHSSVTLTADTYTSVFRDVATSAAEAVAALIPRTRAGSATHRPRTHSPKGDHPEVRSPQVERGGPREDRTHNPRSQDPLLPWTPDVCRQPAYAARRRGRGCRGRRSLVSFCS